MKSVYKRWITATALILAAGTSVALGTPGLAGAATGGATTAASSGACGHSIPLHSHISGVLSEIVLTGKCAASSSKVSAASAQKGVHNTSDVANGTPPLIYHGGGVMETPSTPLTITPIYWSPSAHTMPAAYENLITTYLKDVAAASGSNTNVFSVADEYYGTNGTISYKVSIGTPYVATNALPGNGCTLTSADKTGIYNTGTGYSACLDDAQLQTQVNTVAKATGHAENRDNIFVLFLPQGVESCFNSGSVNTSSNECTINHEPSSAYCAYHSEASSSAIYANMPYPVWGSSTGATCGSDAIYGTEQSPNGNVAADTELSPTSHEINEAITDPDTSTGWYDSSGYENGDECAYIYGSPSGSAGAYYNQVINGGHFLTQEEFSNNDYNLTGGGCVQAAADEA